MYAYSKPIFCFLQLPGVTRAIPLKKLLTGTFAIREIPSLAFVMSAQFYLFFHLLGGFLLVLAGPSAWLGVFGKLTPALQ